VTSVDVQDVMGSHVMDSGGRLRRWRTDPSGQLLFDSQGRPLAHDSVAPAAQKGEGCNVEGTLIVKQVPGNFHGEPACALRPLQIYVRCCAVLPPPTAG